MPWQQELADVAFEYDPVTGVFRYTEVDVTVPRQSGKTTITLAKKVFRLTVLARQLGPQRSTYTAQTRLKARQKLERDFAELLRASSSFREITNAKARPSRATEWRMSLNNGSEAIQFGSGNFLQIDAPSRTGGHGDTLDDGTVDEAFAQDDDTVEAGMRPSMATRRNAQIWVISTAGDARSVYLYRKVLAGRAASESGGHGPVCYVEYSAPDDADPGDPAVWRACMPALGITINEDFIRSEWERAQRKGREGVDTFRRAYLNQWPDIPVLEEDATGVFPPGRWELCRDTSSKIDAETLPMFAVSVSTDRSTASIGACGARPDGLPHLEVVQNAAGTDWIVPDLARITARNGGSVVIDPGSPSGSLIDDLKAEGVKVHTCTAREYAQACGWVFDAVQNKELRHLGDPVLDGAVGNAELRTLAGGFAWDIRAPRSDITPLVAATLACWGHRMFGGDILDNVW